MEANTYSLRLEEECSTPKQVQLEIDPDSYKKNVEIENLSEIKLNSDEYLFHAGTIKKNNKLYAIGGRVLNFVTTSENFHSAKKSVHKNLEKLEWSGGFYRKDIGHKVIEI